jgi:hypothetical protein
MIDHVWTVVCSHSVTDRDTNNVSIFNVIEQISIIGEPKPQGVAPVRFEIVTLWARSDDDKPARGRSRITFMSPSQKKSMLGEERDVDLSKYERLRARRFVQGLPVKEPGRHVIRVELQNEGENRWHKVASVPLKIRFVSPEAKPEIASRKQGRSH